VLSHFDSLQWHEMFQDISCSEGEGEQRKFILHGLLMFLASAHVFSSRVSFPIFVKKRRGEGGLDRPLHSF
jgi:hypothetical protein